MKVKIGDKFTDSHDEPIMIILNASEKQLISEMGEQTKFASFPKKYGTDNIKKFIKDEEEVKETYFK